jgi:hypothetical protein
MSSDANKDHWFSQWSFFVFIYAFESTIKRILIRIVQLQDGNIHSANDTVYLIK